MSRREEVMEEQQQIYDSDKDMYQKLGALARTLADEVDELRGKLDDVRMNIGCARGQRTTQFCAEAAEKDAVIEKLLDLIKKTSTLEYNQNGGVIRGSRTYARACEIAGRAE